MITPELCRAYAKATKWNEHGARHQLRDIEAEHGAEIAVGFANRIINGTGGNYFLFTYLKETGYG